MTYQFAKAFVGTSQALLVRMKRDRSLMPCLQRKRPTADQRKTRRRRTSPKSLRGVGFLFLGESELIRTLPTLPEDRKDPVFHHGLGN
jgi:hypothetical protein